MTSLRKVEVQESASILAFYISGIKNVAPQISIQMTFFLKEEAMEVKHQLQKSKLDGFVASDGWLDKWTVGTQ